jgi:glutamate--cysteine ligase
MSERLERSRLRTFFEKGMKPVSAFGVGLEYERFGVRGAERDDAGQGPGGAVKAPSGGVTPLPIDGPVSVTAVLQALVAERGWKPKLIEGHLFELERGPSRITIEPGGQMELSGATHPSLHHAAEELGRYTREVRAISDPLGIRWLACGTHPTAALDEIPWLSKRRYDVMRQYLPTRGRRAHQMMKGTCGAQVNLDFCDEADAMRKLRVAMTISSTVAAMFANSPITAGKPNGRKSDRSAVWLDTDPDRSGLIECVFSADASFDDYVDWAVSVPMFFLVRDDRFIPMNGRTFGDFLEHGHESYTATWSDWELHLTTLFPDVRLKTYIEVRGTDSNTPPLVLAHAALWKGILYGGSDSLDAAEAPLARLSWDERLNLREQVAQRGLDATAQGRPLLEIARELVAAAEAGLSRSGAPDDSVWLDPLRAIAARPGATPADEVLALYGAGGEDGLARVLDRVSSLAPFA